MPIETTNELPGKPRGLLTAAWRCFALAVTFLTRLPLPVQGEATPAELRASMGWYSGIGMGLGMAGAGAYLVGQRFFPPALCAVLVIVLLEVMTGALHLDGFMDTCDGLGSGKPRERALEIMKDSRVGAMGVFGAIAVLLVKITALASLTPSQAVLPLVAGWAAARVVPALDSWLFRYARPAGIISAFTAERALWPGCLALVIALGIGGYFGGLTGAGLAVGVIALTLFVQAHIAQKLGGLTGDVYGMGIELAETLSLLASSALAWHR